MEKPVLIVMAAGMGSRYGGLKQLDPVGGCGQLIIDYAIYDARRAGFETVIFVIKHSIEAAFRAAIGERLAKVMHVEYAFQEADDLPSGYTPPEGREKPWGTAQAVLAARKFVRGPFAVINADDYYGPEGFAEIYAYLTAHPDTPAVAEYAMVGYLLKNTLSENGSVARGLCEETAEHYLASVTELLCIEKTEVGARHSTDGGTTWQTLSGEAIVSLNLWGFSAGFMDEAWAAFPAFLDKAMLENPLRGEFFLPSVVSSLLTAGKARAKVLRSADKWYGVTYQEDKAVVVAAIAEKTAQGLYPADLWGQNA